MDKYTYRQMDRKSNINWMNGQIKPTDDEIDVNDVPANIQSQ